MCTSRMIQLQGWGWGVGGGGGVGLADWSLVVSGGHFLTRENALKVSLTNSYFLQVWEDVKVLPKIPVNKK